MKEGKTAILMNEVSPDIFSMSLGHLKPGSRAIIRMTYMMELPVENGMTRLTIPTTIAPRYRPKDCQSKAAKLDIKYNDGSESPAPLSIEIETFMKNKIKKIRCPSHDLRSTIKRKQTDHGQFHATTTLKNGTVDYMNRDLVLIVEADHGDPMVLVEKTQDSTVAMLSLIPSFKQSEQKTELIFLVDRSASMGWQIRDSKRADNCITLAKEALQLFLHSLPTDCYFNIWSFGSQFSRLFHKSVKYNENNLMVAKNHVDSMTANYGGTDIYDPLQEIFDENVVKNHARQVLLLTDGAVHNAGDIIELVQTFAFDTRIFTLGLGPGACKRLVDGIARASNGMSILSGLHEDLRPKVMTLLKNAITPTLENVQVRWNAEKEERTLLGYRKMPKLDFESVGTLMDGTRMLSYK